MAKQSTAARMAKLVRRWRTSEESGASFARRHGVRPWTFWCWSRKVCADPSPSPLPPPTFVQVRLAPPVDTGVIEIVLAGGDRVHVRPEASVDLLRAVMTVLRPPC